MTDTKLVSASRPLPVMLPYEILRDIFELAAKSNSGCATKFAMVSYCVQQWVEALIYETIVLDLPISKNKLFLRTFNSRTPAFFAKHVKRLYISTMISCEQAQRIVSACTGATSVACWADVTYLKLGTLLGTPLSHNIRRLSIKAEALWPSSGSICDLPPSSSFENLTHLEIVNPPNEESKDCVCWDRIHDLPALAHLAFGVCTESNAYLINIMESILSRPNSTLQTLIIVSDDVSFLFGVLQKTPMLVNDNRVVVIPNFYWPFMSEIDYWKSVNEGGPDFWSAARSIILGRLGYSSQLW